MVRHPAMTSWSSPRWTAVRCSASAARARRTVIVQSTVTIQVLASSRTSPLALMMGMRNPAAAGANRYLAAEASWRSPEART